MSYYNINPELCSCRLTYAYAQDASLPISIAHYNHEASFPSSYTTRPFEHDWCSIFIYLSGNFSFIMDDKIYSPGYGDAVIMREDEIYSSCFHSSAHMDYYEINLPLEFFSKVKVKDFLNLFYNRRHAENNMLCFDQITTSLVIEKLRSIESCDSTSELLIYSYVIQILDMLYNSHTTASALVTPQKIPSALKKAISFIHAEYLNIYSISEVASSCNVSTVYLSRIFKKHLNCTPNDYIINLRISHAKHLLANGKSLTETCFNSGFNSYTYFISKFKSTTGITPAKFKKDILHPCIE